MAGTESIIEASHSGELYKSNSGTDTYAVMQAAADATTTVNDTHPIVGQDHGGASYPTWRYIYRAGLAFDISAIPSSSTIISVTLSLYGKYDGTNAVDFDLVLVSGSDLADTLVDADYGDLLDETTSYGSFSVTYSPANWDTAGWNVITLNSTGLAAIQAALGGTVRFGLRSSRDIAATEPTEEYEYVEFYGSGDTGKKPKLTIAYYTFLYPTYPISRSGSLVHRYDRGIFNLEIFFGDVLSDFDTLQALTRAPKSYEPDKTTTEIAKEEAEKILRESKRGQQVMPGRVQQPRWGIQEVI